MPLVIKKTLQLPGRIRSLKDVATRYSFLENYEGTQEIDVVKEASTQQQQQQQQQEKAWETTGPVLFKCDEEELVSEVLSYITKECQHCYNNEELRKALIGNVTSVVFVAGGDDDEDETATRRHLNIAFQRKLMQPSTFAKSSSSSSTFETPSQFALPQPGAGSGAEVDDSSTSISSTEEPPRKRHCLSSLSTTVSQSWRRIQHKASCSTSYCRME